MKHKYEGLILILLTALLLVGCAGKGQSELNITRDMRGQTDYEQILKYIADHPEETVLYDVTLGGETYAPDVQELTLAAGSAAFDELMANLKYLPNVSKISLPETDLTAEQIAALKESYPGIQVEYTVVLGDQVLEMDVQELDLSWITPEEIDAVAEKLAMLPGLNRVELMDAQGVSALGVTDVKKLQDACPGVFFQYSFELFGKIVSTSDERIEYEDVAIGNKKETEIRQALDILTCCTYFKLDDCGVSTPVMAGIRDDYPDVKVVWRIHIEYFSMLTDEKVLRLTHEINNDNIHDLKYMTETTHLDLGHNDYLSDISFVQYMPNLECVILSGSSVQDMSYFANCKKLLWLELCFCWRIEDLSVLENHPTLKYLNVSFTKFSDLSVLENVPLERFNCLGRNISAEEQKAFQEKHPDCLAVFEGKQPYGYGWRYNDYGDTHFEYYAEMFKLFRYGDQRYFGNHKER